MALLSVNSLDMGFGEDDLFLNMSFEIQPGDRIGLIGVNGSGKTTLFKLLVGDYKPNKGTISLGKGTTIGYMEQHVCRNLDRSAYNEVVSVFSHLSDIEMELDTLNAQISAGIGDTNKLVERQAMLHDEFTRDGGLTYRSRARSALLGLGFDDSRMSLPVGSLSGGQRAKLQLAKLLLCGAKLLLLDEPTNHLDVQAVEWLEEYLLNSNSSYIVISHDRYFLDRVTNKTFDLEHKRLTMYKGNYSTYLPQKQERELTKQREYDNTMREIHRLEGIIEQQKRWNREKNIKTAESKQKVIDRLQKNLEKPENAPGEINFTLSANERSGDDVLLVENLAVGFDGNTIFENVNMDIKRGERVFLIGPNGCGKTSLLKTLMKLYEAQSGRITLGEGVKIGYYDQIQQNIDSNKTIFDEISDKYPAMTNTEIRNTLARFMFKGEDVFKYVSDLSGGERARVLLTELMLSGANFLLLDEPTNHLDISSCEALQTALMNYEGTLLAVSHDRYLINSLADRIYYLTDRGVEEFRGSYDEFMEKTHKDEVIQKPKQKQESENKLDYKNKKERDAQRRKAKADLNRLEAKITEIEESISELEEQLQAPETASDYELATKLSEELQAKNDELEQYMDKWAKLSEIVESTES